MLQTLARAVRRHNLFHFEWAYLLQSLFAAGYILVSFFLLDALQEGWAIAPLAASTLIAFTFPQAKPSSHRYLMGGYLVAAVTGCLFSWLNLFWRQATTLHQIQVLCCTLAMFAAMLLMVCLDFKHPPAAAMSITLVLTEEPLPVAAASFACICMLCFILRLLKRWLRNL